MAFLDNNPTFKYVKISGLNIIHEGISYRISEIYSSSKYFYWDKNKSPNELITSNIRLTESASVFLICMNDRGIHTEVNHDGLTYNFGGYTSGGGGGDVSKTEFNALKVQVSENKEAYMNVSQSVEGIYQVVGDSEELKDGTIIKHINSLKQTSTSMDLKIQELNTRISDEYEELRDRCSDSLVDLLANISTLKIDFEHFAEEDEELSEEGKNVITTDIENTRGKLNTLKGIVDEILTILNDGERLEEHTDLNSAFNDMNTDITNMLSLISRSISDGGISPDDIINVILAIGTATQKLNILKATVDEIMTLGLGGTIYDSYSQIHVDNERIRTTVKQTESIIYGALKSSSTEYYSSTSTDILEGGGWQSTPPVWEAGRYIWQRIKYEYASGQISYSTPVCIAGAKGDKGEDGSSVKILGSYNTYEELIEAHPLDNEDGDGYLIQGDLYVWTGTQFENVGQIKGENGDSAHIHIKYSNDGGQTFTGNNGEDTGLYIGIYSDFSATDSNDVNDYTWSLIKGEDGKDGLNGIDGINGKDGVSIIWKGTLTEHPSGAENGWAYYNSVQGKSFVYQDETWYQMTIDGADGIKGNDGVDGLSIVWRGEFKTPPSRPETNWVYRDTDNGIVYIYNGSAWEAMTYDGSDGVDGTNGTDGLSIVWKGESSTPPSNAEENWVYRDTDDGIIYIYTEGKWVIMAVDGIDGVDGTNGINGSSLLIFTTDYSSNQSTIGVWSKQGYKRNWVVKEDITKVQTGDNALIKVNNSTRKIDCFIIVKVDSVNVNTSSINATSYGLVDKGEDGNDGLSVFITYHDSIEKPDLPTGDGTTNGWHTDATDNTRWMSQKVALSANEGTWGEPIKIKGEDGSSVKILGTYNSLEELLAKHPIGTNQDGDGYLINGELYVWNDNEFLNVGRIKGEDGEKGEDGTSMYLHIKYSNDGGKTFTGNNGEDEGTYIGTYADREEADSMDVTKYKWVKFSPQSLIKSTPQWYLSTSNTEQTGGSWTETMPELKEEHYLWLRYKLDWENPTQTTYTTPTLEQLYENMKEVIERQSTLEQDMNGFRTMVSETYATKGDVTDVEDYLTNNYTTTKEMKSMIDQSASQIKTSVSETYATISTVNTVDSTANSALSKANTANTNATKAQTAANTANTNATKAQTAADKAQTAADTANTNATNAQTAADTANTNATNALDKANTNASNITTITTKQSSLEQTVDKISTKISSVEAIQKGTLKVTSAQYYLSTSLTSLSGGSWQDTAPTWTQGKYMWQRMKYEYVDGEITYSTPVCIAGATGATGSDGKGVSAITNYYLATSSSSGVTTSTSGWTTTVQSVSSSKKYLWNYEKVTYTDNSTTSTTPCIIGTYGDTGATGTDGVGISNITEYYQVGTSSTTVPTSWVTTPPTLTKTYKYLWNYEKITYTNSTTKETSKRVIGVYGDTGATGATGEKGQSLANSTPQWYLSSSKTSQTGGSWVETMPTITANKYLWLRYKLVWENPTSTTYTTPTLEQTAEAVKTVSSKQSTLEQDLDGFKTTVSETYATKNDVSSTYATKSQVNQTASDWTATFNAGYNQGIINMNANGITVQQGASRTAWDSQSLKFYEGSSLYSFIKDGRLTFAKSNGDTVGFLGRATWSDETKYMNVVSAEYGHSVVLGTRRQNDLIHTEADYISASTDGVIDGTLYCHVGSNILNGHVHDSLVFRQKTIYAYTNKPGELYATDAGEFYMYGDNDIWFGVTSGGARYRFFRLNEDTTQDNRGAVHSYAPLYMHNHGIYNATVTTSLDGQSTYTYSLRNKTLECNIYATMSFTKDEIRYVNNETCSTMEMFEYNEELDEWVVNEGVYTCYCELPVFMAENIEENYHINIGKIGWGDYRIKEKTPYYFIVESEHDGFQFTYEVVAKQIEKTNNNAIIANDSVNFE